MREERARLAGDLRVFDSDPTQCDHREHSRSQALIESSDSAKEWQAQNNLPASGSGHTAHVGQRKTERLAWHALLTRWTGFGSATANHQAQWAIVPSYNCKT
jgi:hypothetical protein